MIKALPFSVKGRESLASYSVKGQGEHYMLALYSVKGWESPGFISVKGQESFGFIFGKGSGRAWLEATFEVAFFS